MKRGRIVLLLVAVAAATLSLMNASWIAPAPKGRLQLISHRGIAQPVGGVAGGCSARSNRGLGHSFIENTHFSLQNAVRLGARGFALDVRTTADGRAVVFRDAMLDCRTDGTGAVRDRTLDYLKGLDVGHGYSADGGRTFPLRGRGVGGMLTVEDVLRDYSSQTLIFVLHDPVAADAALADFGRAGMAIGEQHGFVGPPETLARLRRRGPAGWVLDRTASEACLADYRRTGWLGLVPERCHGVTLDLSRQGEWTLWGWPYRFLDRLAGAGARFFMAGDRRSDGELVGLETPEQLGEVPLHYRGLLLIENMWEVGRSLER